MFSNPLKTPEMKGHVKELAKHNKESKLKLKERQRKLATNIKAKRTPSQKEEHHEQREWRALNDVGDRTADDYRG